MKCMNDGAELEEHRHRGVAILKCPMCDALWTPLTALAKKRDAGALLKTPPNARRKPCLSCAGEMEERTIACSRILVCDSCQHAWMNKATLLSWGLW